MARKGCDSLEARTWSARKAACMIDFDEIGLTPEAQLDVDAYCKDVEAFRSEGPLDRVSLAKLEEHFRALHVYNSAGIEGNRLTLQETLLVLRDGMDISGKPLRDSIEARNLGQAFDYLKELLAGEESPVRETDLRHLHELVVGDSPGAVAWRISESWRDHLGLRAPATGTSRGA